MPAHRDVGFEKRRRFICRDFRDRFRREPRASDLGKDRGARLKPGSDQHRVPRFRDRGVRVQRDRVFREPQPIAKVAHQYLLFPLRHFWRQVAVKDHGAHALQASPLPEFQGGGLERSRGFHPDEAPCRLKERGARHSEGHRVPHPIETGFERFLQEFKRRCEGAVSAARDRDRGFFARLKRANQRRDDRLEDERGAAAGPNIKAVAPHLHFTRNKREFSRIHFGPRHLRSADRGSGTDG